jgi:hypothetical protein
MKEIITDENTYFTNFSKNHYSMVIGVELIIQQITSFLIFKNPKRTKAAKMAFCVFRQPTVNAIYFWNF